MGLDDHPGYLGLTSRGVIALHADWPAYPIEHGWPTALFNLCCFPAGTEFRVVDDIDRCLLLRADYATRHSMEQRLEMHVAIWHLDMQDLADEGFVSGAEFGTERDWRALERSMLRESIRAQFPESEWTTDPLDNLAIPRPDGSFQPVSLPNLQSYDDDPEDRSWFLRGTEPITATLSGHERFQQLAEDADLELPSALSEKVGYLLNGGLLDTAVREVAVAIEMAMRARTATSSFGRRLVNEFFDQLVEEANWLPSAVKTDRVEVVAAFQFVRNEFAHNTVDLTLEQARALVLRLSHALATITSYERTDAESDTA